MTASAAPPYAPRDVINAPAIKRAIEARSRERSDAPDIAAWLLNHFYRHVVGNLAAPAPAVQAVESVENARRLHHPASVPDWALKRLSQANSAAKNNDANGSDDGNQGARSRDDKSFFANRDARKSDNHRDTVGNPSGDAGLDDTHGLTGDATHSVGHDVARNAMHDDKHDAHNNAPKSGLWWIDPQSEPLLALEQRLLEFLGSRAGTALEGKLIRINCPQALAQWEAEHAAFAARVTAGWRDSTPDAVAPVWQGEHGAFVELLPTHSALRAEMAYESQMMRHCLGQFAQRRALTGGYGEHYAAACEAGTLRLFSYRTGQALPHITISADVRDDGMLVIDQIKGKQNRPPIARYQGEVRAFLNSLPTSGKAPADALRMGLVRVAGGWLHASEVTREEDQLAVLAQAPSLIAELPHPSPLMQWLIAARDADALDGMALSPAVAEALRVARAGSTPAAQVLSCT
ncbi:MAG: hypothetical protein ABI589_06460 [Burkholderiales bacterium]